jgi:hypothetical protein
MKKLMQAAVALLCLVAVVLLVMAGPDRFITAIESFFSSVAHDEAFDGLVALAISFLSFVVAMASLYATVHGWKVARKDAHGLQKDQLRDQVLQDAWGRVAAALDEYLFWLERHAVALEFLPARDGESFSAGMREIAQQRKERVAGLWWTEIRTHDGFFPGLRNDAEPLRARHNEVRDKSTQALAISVVFLRVGIEAVDASHREQLKAACDEAASGFHALHNDIDALRERWQRRVYEHMKLMPRWNHQIERSQQ